MLSANLFVIAVCQQRIIATGDCYINSSIDDIYCLKQEAEAYCGGLRHSLLGSAEV